MAIILSLNQVSAAKVKKDRLAPFQSITDDSQDVASYIDLVEAVKAYYNDFQAPQLTLGENNEVPGPSFESYQEMLESLEVTVGKTKVQGLTELTTWISVGLTSLISILGASSSGCKDDFKWSQRRKPRGLKLLYQFLKMFQRLVGVLRHLSYPVGHVKQELRTNGEFSWIESFIIPQQVSDTLPIAMYQDLVVDIF
ncbi:hypothetical protein N8I77_004958 [Diaporthe amygdali]|uniref:Uncharacterized protein n=1 Tax=Phomopsis amygdali TaxID=1214568 RepID=A0AAD9SM47_PHOAM|nr:hypothetical protein N8I77_004958 [Diaporthe amygdali]